MFAAISVGPVAQLVEQLTFNQWVTGSNPVGLTNHPQQNASILPLVSSPALL